MITRNKIALIHVAKSELGLSEQAYRVILESNFKVSSSKELNNFQFEKLIEIFKKLGFRQVEKITKRQLYRIDEYIKKLNWDKKRLQGFIKRQIGLEKEVDKLKKTEASKLITGLKNMERRLKKNEKEEDNNLSEMS